MRERAAAGIDEQRIDMPVVTALEFDDLVAFRETAGKPNARHGCFRAAVYHPHFFDRRDPAADQFRHLHFERVGAVARHEELHRLLAGPVLGVEPGVDH